MTRLDCTDENGDLDLCCPQNAQGPFSCIEHHIDIEHSALRGLDALVRISANLDKGDNFCVFVCFPLHQFSSERGLP